jgi:uncharacterized protein (DUF983 family)
MTEFHAEPSPVAAGLRCRCPRCGEGRLFSGFLTLSKRCEVCDLDFSFIDSGDGPAIFVIFAVSPVVIVLAFIVEALFHPAPLVHLVIWFPVTIILCLIVIRPFKAIMVALQYRHNAHEGRL